MATKVKPSRLQVTGTPQAGQVPVYVDEDTFQWGAGGGGGGGDVIGPVSSTDGNIVLFDGTTGKAIKDSGVGLSSKLDATALSNNAYGGGWNGDTTHTPTKDALYDKIHTMDVEIGNKAADTSVVKLTGNQTIAGTKTFSTSPVVPSKTTDATNTGTAIATEAQVYAKQDKLTTQTAYTTKGTSTKVPTITTNTLGQVTAITETSIAFPVTSVNGSTGAVVLDADDISDSTTTNKFVTQNDKDTWDSKQDELVSEVNIRTINGTSILGSGDITTPVGPTYTAGTGISIVSDAITNTGVTSFNGSTGAVTYTAPVTSVNGNTGAVTVNAFSPSNVGSTGNILTKTSTGYRWSAPTTGSDVVKIFDYPSVGDDISNMLGWLASGGGAVMSENVTKYYTVLKYDDQAGYVTAINNDSSTYTTKVTINVDINSEVTSIVTDNLDYFEPSNAGSTNQVLTKTAGGYEWATAASSYEAGPGIAVGTGHRDTQGPCNDGYHIATRTEWNVLCEILFDHFGITKNANAFPTYLKMPLAGYRDLEGDFYDNGYGEYWSANSVDSPYASYALVARGTVVDFELYDKTSGMNIRPFKDNPVIPADTSVLPAGWTKTDFSSSTGIPGTGIYYNTTLGIISLNPDGVNWLTIADKNLGATVLYNYGDTLTDANCGKFYQWGNNYGFSRSGTITKSSSMVDASSYGPGNYYSSSTFIYDTDQWDSSDNRNLWGGVTDGVWLSSGGSQIVNTGVLSVNGNTGNVVVGEFSPSNYGTSGNVLTKTPSGYQWSAPAGGDVLVSSQANNILTSGMKIWAGTQTNYDNLGTYDGNTVYLTIE